MATQNTTKNITKSGTKGKKPVEAKAFLGPNKADRLIIELDMMKTFISKLVLDGGRVKAEFEEATKDSSASFALKNYAKEAYRGQIVQEIFGVVANKIANRDKSLDIIKELEQISTNLTNSMSEGVFLPNSSDPMMNLLNLYKGEFYGHYIREISRRLQSYAYYVNMTEAEYDATYR